MKIATKTLVSLLIITALSLSNSNFVTASGNMRPREPRIDRVTKRHDRKLELHASVLGISTEQLRQELKTLTFDQILKKHGFKNRQAFRIALAGKIKDELKKRGWSENKIQKVVSSRLARMNEKT